MAQWINIGKYFFKWLPDLFLYCGRSCVFGFCLWPTLVLELSNFQIQKSEIPKSSKNSKIPDWLINPGKSLQIQLRAIAYRQIINHGASRTHFWSFKNFQDRYLYVSLLYRYSRHLSWLNWHFSTITWFFIPRIGFLLGQNTDFLVLINEWLLTVWVNLET